MKIGERAKANLFFFIPALLFFLLLFLFRHRLTHILLPVLLGLLISHMMEPAVYMMVKKWHFKRNWAIPAAFVLVIAVVGLVLAFLIPALVRNLKEIIENGPAIRSSLNSLMERISGLLGKQGSSFVDIEKTVTGLETWAVQALERLARSYMKVLSGVLDVVTAFILAFYMLRDKQMITGWMLSLFPYTWRTPILDTAHELGRISAKFIQGQLLIAFIVGLIETAGLLYLKIPFAVLLGIIGGLSNLIPYFGPVIGAVPSVLAALLISPVRAIWTALLFVLVQQLDNNFLGPKIIEGKLGIHPVATIIVVFIGGEFFGLAGILLAVPVYAMLRCILRRITKSLTKTQDRQAA